MMPAAVFLSHGCSCDRHGVARAKRRSCAFQCESIFVFLSQRISVLLERSVDGTYRGGRDVSSRWSKHARE